MGRSAQAIARQPAEAYLEIGASTPIPTPPIPTTPIPKGWRRTAIYLRAVGNLNLVGLGFSLGTSTAEPLRFVPAAQTPSLVDNGLAGKLALAWLEATNATAGQRILLGYVETPANTPPLSFFGASANAAGDGRDVRLKW